MNLDVRIQPQKRKSLAMKITPDGIVVMIPESLPSDCETVSNFIKRGIDKLNGNLKSDQCAGITKGQLLRIIERWSDKLGVNVKRVQVRRMKKWASCSSGGIFTVNRDVLSLPERLAEYVVCHELVHLKIPYHGKAFRVLLGCYMPDWRERHWELMMWGVNDEHKKTRSEADVFWQALLSRPFHHLPD